MISSSSAHFFSRSDTNAESSLCFCFDSASLSAIAFFIVSMSARIALPLNPPRFPYLEHATRSSIVRSGCTISTEYTMFFSWNHEYELSHTRK